MSQNSNPQSQVRGRRWWWPVLGAAGTAALWRFFNRTEKPEPTFQDWVVVVTGASSGIGRATAIAFAERGAHVVLVARRVKKLNELADELVHLAPSTLVIQADVSRTDDLDRVAEQVEETYGRLDVLINNAGVAVSGAHTRIDPDRIGQTTDINLFAPMYLTHKLLPLMIANGSGHLLFVSSVASGMTAPGMGVYSATKAGLNAFAASMRHELRPYNIHVAQILPGFTRTAMVGEGSRREVRQQLVRSGVLMPGVALDEPQAVAQAMVDSVLRRRSRVVMGGITMRMGVWGACHLPFVMDIVYNNRRTKQIVDNIQL